MAEQPVASAVTTPRADVVVVGSANVDLSIVVDRLPQPGETVLGGSAVRGSGGKGANQAVAAARLGAQVAMVARVGDDDSGAWLIGRLAAEGVDVAGVSTTAGTTSGLAVVMVDGQGENSIVVSPGANRMLATTDIEQAGPALAQASVVLTQLETSLAVARSLRSATSARLILNPAPASSRLDVSGFDVVVPNRGELATLVGGDPSLDLTTVADQAGSLDAPVVVVTLGARGAMVVANEPGAAGGAADVVAVPALAVTALDTTAAGDAFCGALAVALAGGASVAQATHWAVRVSGLAVTARGAQSSLPHLAVVGSWGDVPES